MFHTGMFNDLIPFQFRSRISQIAAYSDIPVHQ